MTRAQEKLYLTSAETRTMYGKTDYTKESQFMREVDHSLLDGHAVYSRRNPATSADRFRADAPFSGGYGFGGSGMYGGTNASGSFGNVEVNRPFQQIQKIKQEVARTAAQTKANTAKAQDLAQGDRVKHPKFGEGLIIEASGSTVSVMFDTFGLKKLAKDIAPLTKI